MHAVLAPLGKGGPEPGGREGGRSWRWQMVRWWLLLRPRVLLFTRMVCLHISTYMSGMQSSFGWPPCLLGKGEEDAPPLPFCTKPCSHPVSQLM